jgi:transposase
LGQSSQWQRQLLIRSALKLLNLQGKVLLGEREYIGVEWFTALKRAGIDIVIRLRVSDYKVAMEACGKSIDQLESKAKSQLGEIIWQPFTLNEGSYSFVMLAYRNRSGKTEFLRLITTLTPAQALERYKQRYRIESMFKHLKSNGFDLESLHLQYGYKIRLMMAVVVLAYTLALIYGLVDFKHKVKPKKHGSPEMSVFRWGLDKWQAYLSHLGSFMTKLECFTNNWIKTSCNITNPFVP